MEIKQFEHITLKFCLYPQVLIKQQEERCPISSICDRKTHWRCDVRWML